VERYLLRNVIVDAPVLALEIAAWSWDPVTKLDIQSEKETGIGRGGIAVPTEGPLRFAWSGCEIRFGLQELHWKLVGLEQGIRFEHITIPREPCMMQRHLRALGLPV